MKNHSPPIKVQGSSPFAFIAQTDPHSWLLSALGAVESPVVLKCTLSEGEGVEEQPPSCHSQQQREGGCSERERSRLQGWTVAEPAHFWCLRNMKFLCVNRSSTTSGMVLLSLKLTGSQSWGSAPRVALRCSARTSWFRFPFRMLVEQAPSLRKDPTSSCVLLVTKWISITKMAPRANSSLGIHSWQCTN